MVVRSPCRYRGAMLFDGISHQVPDTDPGETEEWLDSFDAIVDARGRARARYLLMKLLERARTKQVDFPATVSTPYVNTIPADAEPWFPGDEYLERRIRAYIRWNAAAMVIRANTRTEGIGGHLVDLRQLGRALRGRLQPLLPGQGRRRLRRPGLLPGPRLARASTPAPSSRAGSPRTQLDNFRHEVGRRRPPQLPPPPLAARLLGVPDRVDGARARSRPSTRPT